MGASHRLVQRGIRFRYERYRASDAHRRPRHRGNHAVPYADEKTSHRPNPNGRPIHRPVRRFVNSREDNAAREVSQANCAHGGGGGGVLQKSESLLQVDASPARLRQGEEGAHLHQLQRAFAGGHDTDEQPIPNVHRGGCARDLT